MYSEQNERAIWAGKLTWNYCPRRWSLITMRPLPTGEGELAQYE